jgi:hypothetical protein
MEPAMTSVSVSDRTLGNDEALGSGYATTLRLQKPANNSFELQVDCEGVTEIVCA